MLTLPFKRLLTPRVTCEGCAFKVLIKISKFSVCPFTREVKHHPPINGCKESLAGPKLDLLYSLAIGIARFASVQAELVSTVPRALQS